MIIVINCKSTRTKLPFHHDNKKKSFKYRRDAAT